MLVNDYQMTVTQRQLDDTVGRWNKSSLQQLIPPDPYPYPYPTSSSMFRIRPHAAVAGCRRCARHVTMYHYTVLGLKRNSNREEVTAAFRALAKEYHPDADSMNKNEARMKLITNAYNTILESFDDGMAGEPKYKAAKAQKGVSHFPLLD